MMNNKILLPLFGLFFVLSACGTQPYLKENTAFILFKTPTFKYADMGFVYENTQEVKAEIYGSGQALLSLTVKGDSVCSSFLACMPAGTFNAHVLSASYPSTLLNNIFRGNPLMKKKNMKKVRNGFTQTIVSPGKYKIHYSVLNKEIIFNDTINAIRIEVKKQ